MANQLYFNLKKRKKSKGSKAHWQANELAVELWFAGLAVWGLFLF